MKGNFNDMVSIVIGGLLHDIGKFYQKTLTQQERSGETANAKKQEVGYSHALYTKEFIDKHKKSIPYGDSGIYEQSSYHHNTGDNEYARVISAGDRLSSGLERKKEESNSDNEISHSSLMLPLSSVFPSINIGKGDSASPLKYSVRSLSFDNIFAGDIEENSPQVYKKLWNEFTKDFEAIGTTSAYIYIAKLASLLEKYTWTIPASSRKEDGQDVSLYDHLSMSAAISAALFRYNEIKGLHAEDDVFGGVMEKYRLVLGDISGIQKFIFKNLKYNSEKKSAKRLRGRSFLVSMMSDIVAHYILSELGYTPINMIMNAGGRFAILVDGSEETLEEIKSLEKIIEKDFYKNYNAEITMVLDYSTAFKPSSFSMQDNKFKDVYEKATESLEEKKNRKFSTLILNEDFSPIHKTGLDTEEQNNREIELGDKVVKGKYIIVEKSVEDSHLLGYKLRISNDNNESFNGTLMAYSFNNNENASLPLKTIASYMPRKENGEIKTFEDMANNAEGLSLLGVFKADVDNLGLIFSKGLRDRFSIARYSFVSRMLNAFFSGYLPTLFEKEFPNTYTVFAGGDDLLLVCPWSEMLPLAQKIQSDFTRFSCNNKNITISAGGVLGGNKQPINYLAEKAETELERAKDSGRDRFSVFNTRALWNNMPAINKWCSDFETALASKGEKEKLSTAMLYSLLGYRKMYLDCNGFKENKTIKNINSLLWKSYLNYNIKRNLSSKTPIYKRLTHLLEDESPFKYLNIPVSWVLYKQRKKEEQKNE